jgi:hypothetical protein
MQPVGEVEECSALFSFSLEVEKVEISIINTDPFPLLV